MADITLTYKGSTILSLEDSATKTIKTGGKFCEGDIGVSYVKPSSEVYAAISVTYPAGSTCTATNGAITLTAADTSGQVVFWIPEPSSTPETWTVSCTDGADTDSTTVILSVYGQIEYVDLFYGATYGVTWDGTPTTAWTRTDASANFSDPVPYISGSSSYGSPFDNLSPWKDITRISDSSVGEMVKIPKFWYKLTQAGTTISIQISNKASEGFSVCPACMDRGDGKGERDYILVGRYHCASDYKSKTGVKPVGSKTRAAFRTGIQALGTGVYMLDFATKFTIWMLYLVEFANWNSQDTIGRGCGNGSATQNMGYTDSMPYHTGTTIGSRASYGLGTQYRYIEGLWDNIRDWIDGCYYSSNGLMIIKNPTQFSDSSNGISVGRISSGYPSGFSVKNVQYTFPLFIPYGGVGSNSTYSSDYWSYSSSYACLCSGGFYTQGLDYGLFYIYGTSISDSGISIGSRLMKLP
jgi:hypothetical protein